MRHRAEKKRKQVEALLADPLAANMREVERVSRSLDRAAPRMRVRRGPGYEKFCTDGWPARLNEGVISEAELAELLDVPRGHVAGWMAAFEVDEDARVERDTWKRPEHAEAGLEDFELFRGTYFRDEWGNPYVTTVFHRRWIVAFLRAMLVGGRLVILSPPRHGKTELLTHFCIWLMLRNPNIRIMWVGLNGDIAKMSTKLVRELLENNAALRADFLPPGGTFQPPNRSGRPWTDGEFVISTRTASLKSPTMVAVGKGGKLLSRDADLIVIDDIVDHESVDSPAQREKDVKWINTQLGSRKEAHTAIAGIGSRQHHHDLWGRLVANAAWASIVESAHDSNCTLPRHEGPLPEGHDEWGETTCEVCVPHTACMLWKGKRTFAWLEGQRAAMDDDEHYEMVYLNKTKPAGALHLTEADLKACYNHGRTLGQYPPACHLIAGLDPASGGDQVAFLWAYHPAEERRYMVDLDVERGGGLPGALRVIKLWAELYPDLKTWVVERNAYQTALLEDQAIRKFCSERGISLRPHFTSGHNKWSPEFGVTKQFSQFKTLAPVLDIRTGKPTGEVRPKVDLPWGDAAARAKTSLYRDQLLDFEGASRKTKTDIVMAAWFPETVIRGWRNERRADAEYDYAATSYPDSMLGDMYRQVG